MLCFPFVKCSLNIPSRSDLFPKLSEVLLRIFDVDFDSLGFVSQEKPYVGVNSEPIVLTFWKTPDISIKDVLSVTTDDSLREFPTLVIALGRIGLIANQMHIKSAILILLVQSTQ